MDVVVGEAVEAAVDELQRDRARVGWPLDGATAPATATLHQREAVLVHGRAHPGDVVAGGGVHRCGDEG